MPHPAPSAHLRGQGSTEYLVLLAVVLVVAMVALSLIAFMPGLSTDARQSAADAYWSADARPFSIPEHSQSGSTLTLVLVNTEVDQLVLSNITLAGSGANGVFSTPTYFSAGEKKTRTVAMTGSCAAGDTYEYIVNISYSTANLAHSQFGVKPLVGKCV